MPSSVRKLNLMDPSDVIFECVHIIAISILAYGKESKLLELQ